MFFGFFLFLESMTNVVNRSNQQKSVNVHTTRALKFIVLIRLPLSSSSSTIFQGESERQVDWHVWEAFKDGTRKGQEFVRNQKFVTKQITHIHALLTILFPAINLISINK